MDIFNPKIIVSQEVLLLIAEIDEFKGKWTTLKDLSPDRLSSLRTIATIESVGSSTRIEGSKLSDAEVEKFLQGLKTNSFRSRDEEEVAGYAEVADIVFDSFNEIPFSENYIKQLHGILLKYSSKDLTHRGEYKKFPNSVEAFNADGKSIGVVFQAASPFDTPRLIQELVDWTNAELEKKQLHFLLIIGIFILNFLAIHPFQDGNGRVSRILTTLLLLKTGYTHVPYSSLEKVIEENKEKYYLALRKSQIGLRTENENLDDWILFFLKSLKAQKESLEKKIEKEKFFTTLPHLSQKILMLAKDHGSITNQIIQKALGDNRNTIKLHLKNLVEQKYLVHRGQGKGSRYSLS